jgi:hypothetical protein
MWWLRRVPFFQVFGRAAKYSLFDPSKEMVFITMGKEEKEAGKAAVDVLGNQLAKSGGSWLMQVRARVLCGGTASQLAEGESGCWSLSWHCSVESVTDSCGQPQVC